MGTAFITFYRTRIRPDWKFTFISTFVTGLLVHMYKFTNTLLSNDSLFNQYSSQHMVQSGRWFLSFACGISSRFDLPWVIGLISLVWISITAVILVDLFRVENRAVMLLTGGLLVTFPAVTQTFYYEFTADGYMLAMVLAALTVRFSTVGETRRTSLFLSFACIILTCGIYQAYVCFALVLSLCYFMAELLENRYTQKEYVMWVRRQILIYGLGMAVYYGIWHLLLRVGGTGPSLYLGMETIGQFSLSTIAHAVVQTITAFISAFMVWNFLEYGLTFYIILNILFLLTAAGIIITAIVKSRLLSRKCHTLLFFLCAIFLPFAAFIWYFASPGVQYSTRMEQSICLFYILAAVLAARWITPKKSDLIALLLGLIIFNNAITANMVYFYMHRCYEKSYATAVEIASHIHLLDDGTLESVMVVGVTDWFSEEEYRSGSGLRDLNLLKAIHKNLFSSSGACAARFLSDIIDLELSYYQNPEHELPSVAIDPNWPVPGDWEWNFPLADDNIKKAMIYTDEIANMDCWPAAGSIKVIDHIAVIKLSDIE